MNREDVSSDFQALLVRLSDARLDGSDLKQLGQLIERDAELRRRYLDYCQIHGMLRAEHGLLAAWGVEENEQHSSPRALRFIKARMAFLGTAAVVLAGIALTFASFNRDSRSVVIEPRPPYRGEVVAQLKNELGARFAYGARGERTPTAGAAMPQGTYQLERGIIELESNTGVILTIVGPAQFTLADEQSMRIENGRVAAHVPKEALGYRVETASATVVDLGTDFAVEAVKGQESEVHVFKGQVQVNLHGSKTFSASPLHLATGEATRIDFFTGMPSGIDLDEQRFLRRIEVAPRSYTQHILKLQPAVYYPMEPTGEGTKLKDLSPQRADAEIIFGRTTDPVWAPGKVGLAFALRGPAQQTYAFAENYPKAEADELSVVAWVLAASRPRWASIAKNWAGASDWGQFHFGLYFDSGELEAHIQDSSGKEITVKDTQPLPLNTWHHVAFVADGGMLRLYRNGAEVDAVPYRQLRSDPRIRALAIGTKLNLAGTAPEERDFNMWDGRLDELAIFNHALRAEQIRQLYELGNMESRFGN